MHRANHPLPNPANSLTDPHPNTPPPAGHAIPDTGRENAPRNSQARLRTLLECSSLQQFCWPRRKPGVETPATHHRTFTRRGGTGELEISAQACTFDVTLDFAGRLGLLVTELFKTSLKHALPGGRGAKSVTRQDNTDTTLSLIVSDNGMGSSEIKLPGRPDTGLGTRIVATLFSQLHATTIIETRHRTRTEIRIAIPDRQ